MSPTIAASVTKSQKQEFMKKAAELGISQSELIRMLCFKNLPDLVIGYRSHIVYAGPPTDMKRLKPPPGPEIITKEHITMKKCVSDLKNVFAQGMNILENMEKADLMINAETKEKTDEELEALKQQAHERGYERFMREKQVEEAK